MEVSGLQDINNLVYSSCSPAFSGFALAFPPLILSAQYCRSASSELFQIGQVGFRFLLSLKDSISALSLRPLNDPFAAGRFCSALARSIPRNY